MFRDITTDNQEIYKITVPGDYVFYFENKTNNLIFDIQCEDAHVKIYGLYTCKNSDAFNLHITQRHSSPNSISNVLIKSILYDKSNFNFTGVIDILKEAINSTANLENYNLLLSDKAHVITSPQLEVVPNEVNCKHSAKIIPLDTAQLNYMTSRGISIEAAKQLLIDGFTDEILQIKKCLQK
ncbi:MAG: SufB/SufD family protein [Candidatus Moraniibacteriota bacterium]|jgi:Fe-S cluster assembly protein SufD